MVSDAIGEGNPTGIGFVGSSAQTSLIILNIIIMIIIYFQKLVK